jgi:hypothetical protein
MLPLTDPRCELRSETPGQAPERPFPAFFPITSLALTPGRAASPEPANRREKLLREASERIRAVLLELYDEHGIKAGQVEIDLRYSAYGKTEIHC